MEKLIKEFLAYYYPSHFVCTIRLIAMNPSAPEYRTIQCSTNEIATEKSVDSFLTLLRRFFGTTSIMHYKHTQQMNIDSTRFFTDAEHWTDHSPSTMNDEHNKEMRHSQWWAQESRRKKRTKENLCDTLECLAGFNECTNTF